MKTASRTGGGPLQGVILAAGLGQRMRPLNQVYPKCILPICNKPLICYHIEQMRELGIEEITVLIGDKGFEVSRVLGDGHQFGVRLRYVEQTVKLGIAHAVGRLEPHISAPFLLFLGDVFFSAHDFSHMVDIFDEQQGGAVLATKEEADPAAIRNNYSLHISDEGLVTRVVEKPRYTTNSLKGAGLYLFDLTIFDAIRRTPRTAMRDEYELTESIQVMIDDGHPVRAANIVEEDINLTTPVDLLKVNLRQVSKLADNRLVGDGCAIPDACTIESSVIGSDVVVTHPISIKHSLIFSGSRVQSEGPLEYAVVTPDFMVDCRHEMIGRQR